MLYVVQFTEQFLNLKICIHIYFSELGYRLIERYREVLTECRCIFKNKNKKSVTGFVKLDATC